MNRLAIVLTIIYVFINIVTSVKCEMNSTQDSSSSEESGESEYADLIACKNETGASDIDLARLINRANPITQAAKCLSACYLHKMGVMEQEKFVSENLSEYVSDDTLVGSKGTILSKAIKEIADECKAITDTDKCELAAKILNCLNASAKKRGFCPNVF